MTATSVDHLLLEIRILREDLEDLAGDVPRLVADAWSGVKTTDIAGVRGSGDTDPTSHRPSGHERKAREAIGSMALLIPHVREELRQLRRTAERPRPAPLTEAHRPIAPPLVDHDAELRDVHATRFRQWLTTQRDRADDVGAFARWWTEDRCRPDAYDLTGIRAHLDEHDADQPLSEGAERAWNQWSRIARTPSRR